MSSSALFIGSGFTLQSVVPGVPGTVRVRFTSDPLQANPVGANDGLNINNYTITGPGLAIISSVSVVPGDTQSLDVHLTAPLPSGIWTLTAINIQTPTLTSLGNPNSLAFTISETGDATPLTAGAENDDSPDRVIRKHLSSAIRGPNTDAMIEALSRGDDTNWTNSQLGFNQLFRSTASGKYLDRLASNEGLRRRSALGLSDELFRKLLIRYATSKITHNALRGILEVFYGQDALRAWVETAAEEPYVLSDGQNLTWTLDGKTNFSTVFSQNQFVVMGSAKAIELAAVLTKAMSDAGSDGFAFVIKNAVTGKSRVRIYSGSLGLKSFVRVTGGTAQPFLLFDKIRPTYSAAVTVGDGLTWQYTNPTPTTTKISLTHSGIPKIDVNSVVAGDYVVIGEDVGVVAPGTYSIIDVGQSWSGGNYIQYFTVDQNLGYVGGALQMSNYSYQFFNPRRASTQSGARTVVVSQSQNGTVDIQLPATTQAVNRTNINGAYLHGNPTNSILRYWRDETGLLKIQTETAHGLSTGKWVQLDSFQPRPAYPFISPATGGGSDGGFVSGYRGIPGSSANTDFAGGTLLQDGRVLWVGGAVSTAGVYASPVATGNLLTISGTTPVIDGSEAEGSLRRTYSWASSASLGTARGGHKLTTLQDGRVFATGGFFGTIGAPSMSSTEMYSPSLNTWTAAANMVTGRHGHAQVMLSNGKVLVAGGATKKGTATTACEIFDPALGTWSNAASMLSPRYKASSFLLPNGKVMVAGGYALGRGVALYPSQDIYWKQESATSTLSDNGPGGFSLTVTGTSDFVTGKVDWARRFTGTGVGAGYATGASNGTIRAALLNGWVVDFWIVEPFTTPGGDKTIVAHKGPTLSSTHNALFEVGVTVSGKPYWSFETGSGVEVRYEVSNSPSLTNGRHHIVVSAKVDTIGVQTHVRCFVDNVDLGTTTWSFIPTDGSSGAFWLCGDPKGINPWTEGFRGVVDEIHVAPYTVANETEATSLATRSIRHVKSGGWASDIFSKNEFGGEVLNTCEIYDPTANTWTLASSMRYARGGATAIAVNNNRWVIYPSTEYDTNFAAPNVTVSDWKNYYPNQPGKHAEIYDYNTGVWYPGPQTIQRFFEPMVVDIVSNSQHLVTTSDLFNIWDNTINYNSSGVTAVQADRIELVDWKKGISGNSAHANTAFHNQAVKIADGLIAFAGGTVSGDDSTTTPYFGLWSKHSDAVTGRGLDGVYKITAVPSANIFSVDTKIGKYSSNFGSTGDGGFEAGSTGKYDSYYDGTVVSSATRASGVINVTVTDTTAGIVPGNKIFLNSNSITFPAGIKTVTAVTDTTFSYAESGANVGPTAINGTVSLDYNLGASYELQTGVADNVQGPIIFDPQNGLATTSVDTTITSDLGRGAQLNQLTLASTAGFPDGVGYIVFDFAGSKQSKPIKYLEVIGAETLLMDFGAVVPENYPAGTRVTLLSKLGPYVPTTRDIPGIFYATGSNIGRVAAEELVRAVAAAGISLNVDIVYPGDRGLGAEGAPTESATRLSDAVWVWGPDSFEGGS